MNQPQTTTPNAPELRQPPQPSRFVRPAVDVYETPQGYTLLADMPGVTPDRLDIQVEDGQLTVVGRPENPAHAPTHQEYELLEYRRTFTLADELDSEHITARFQDGVLRLEVPKAPKAQVRKIPILAS